MAQGEEIGDTDREKGGLRGRLQVPVLAGNLWHQGKSAAHAVFHSHSALGFWLKRIKFDRHPCGNAICEWRYSELAFYQQQIRNETDGK